MSRKKILLAFVSILLIAAAVWFVSSRRHDVLYEITNLGTLEGDYSFAMLINNRGHVTGHSRAGSEKETRAFFWSPENGIRDIGRFSPGGMNDRDQIVGFPLGRPSQACLWSPQDGLIDLGTLGGNESWANGINNRGEVVGISDRSQGGECGFIWSATDGMRPLEHEWLAHDINDAGEILCSTNSNISEAFVYDRIMARVVPTEDREVSLDFYPNRVRRSTTKGGGEILNSLPFWNIEKMFPIPIGDGYRVLIKDANGNQSVGAISYEYRLLANALSKKNLPGFLWSSLNEVYGMISYTRAILWDGDEVFDLINLIPADSEWSELIYATSINDSGQIVGVGIIEGKHRAFLLTPIKGEGLSAQQPVSN